MESDVLIHAMILVAEQTQDDPERAEQALQRLAEMAEEDEPRKSFRVFPRHRNFGWERSR